MEAKKAKKEKIKVTVTSKEVKELEVSFPYYTRNEGLYCKFFSKSGAIWVVDYSFAKRIEYSNGAAPESWLTFDPITGEEFNQKFNEVMNALIDINNEKAI